MKFSILNNRSFKEELLNDVDQLQSDSTVDEKMVCPSNEVRTTTRKRRRTSIQNKRVIH